MKVITEESSQRMIQFATNHLATKQPQDDYFELFELTILFLGGIPPHGVKFRVPGPIQHARRMSKLLYALKMWIFQNQFSLIAQEEEALKQLYNFAIEVYVEAWFTAPDAIEAPRRDLALVKSLLQLSNKAVSDATSQKMSKHLWYLFEEEVALSIFDDAVSFETKQHMVTKLQGEDDE